MQTLKAGSTMKKLAAHFGILILFLLGPICIALAADPIGIWLTDDGQAKVEISACDKAICGKIIWLKEPNDTRGQPVRDLNNVDRTKRDRPVLGLTVLEMRKDRNAWVGEVYDPRDGKGKPYKASLSMRGPDKIYLEGCTFFELICDDETWTRTEK